MSNAEIVEFPGRRRIANKTGSEHCPHCQDDAQLVVGTDSFYGHEVNAPCPFCERGYRLEFGLGAEKVRKPDGSTEWKPYTNPRPPWGKDGYWQGRELPDGLSTVRASAQSESSPFQAPELRSKTVPRGGTVSPPKLRDL